jgi:predicted HicB family RNase H-like nuclease
VNDFDQLNENENLSKKNSTMTFRIDNNVLKILKTESEKHQISLNSLVNQLLKRFVEWDM